MRILGTRAELEPFLNPTENANVEYKARVDPSPGEGLSRMAKSMASFANGLGGLIIVGVKDKTGEAVPLTAEEARDFQRAFDHAQRDYCRPSPFIAPRIIDWDSGKILVVHVQAHATAIVGSKWLAGQQKPNDDPSWIFPRRVGRDTAMITPENLPLYMDAAIRRAVVQLHHLVAVRAQDQHGKVKIFLSYFNPPTNKVRDKEEIMQVNINEIGNFVAFVLADAPNVNYRIPLDDVETVWEGRDGWWFVKVKGYLYNDGDRLEYKSR